MLSRCTLIFGALVSLNCKTSKRFFQISEQFTPRATTTGRSINCWLFVLVLLLLLFLFLHASVAWEGIAVCGWPLAEQQLNRLNARCRLKRTIFEVSLGCLNGPSWRCCRNVASVGVDVDCNCDSDCYVSINVANCWSCLRGAVTLGSPMNESHLDLLSFCFLVYRPSGPYGLFELGFGVQRLQIKSQRFALHNRAILQQKANCYLIKPFAEALCVSHFRQLGRRRVSDATFQFASSLALALALFYDAFRVI